MIRQAHHERLVGCLRVGVVGRMGGCWVRLDTKRTQPSIKAGNKLEERVYHFELKVTFWLVAGFTILSFLLWLTLPVDHRAGPVLERTWTSLLTGFAGLVMVRLSRGGVPVMLPLPSQHCYNAPILGVGQLHQAAAGNLRWEGPPRYG